MRFTDASWSVLVLAIATSLCACSGEKQADDAATPSVPEFPAAQQAFHALNKSCDEAYDAGQNEIQKSMAFNSCNQQRSEFANQSQISGWVGEINEISTDQGADVVSVDINAVVDGFDITFMTAPNRVADSRVKTLITPDNPLFNALANLNEGDKVNFDAVFVSHPDAKRGVWENSLTEGGSMSDPAFTVKFLDIRRFGAVGGDRTHKGEVAVVQEPGLKVADPGASNRAATSSKQDAQYCSNIYRNSTGEGVTKEDISEYRAQCPDQDLPPSWEGVELTATDAKEVLSTVKPSFDCKKASITAEYLICSNSELAKLDADLARAYSAARSRTSGSLREQIVFTQKRWVQDERNGCGEDVECMKATYADRLALLNGL